ncbi:MAG: lysylphosphatidylglycerol synthase domain-containing protein [Polyangiaceae bacterium]
MQKNARHGWVGWLQLLGLVIVAASFWLGFRHVAWDKVGELLSRAGVAALVVLLPCGIVQLMDALGCWLVLRRLEARPPLGRVLVAQLAGEAMSLWLPLGFAVGEPVRPWLLSAGGHAPASKAIAAVATRKLLLVSSEAVSVLLALYLARDAIPQLSQALYGNGALLWIGVGVAAVLAAVATSLLLAVRGGRWLGWACQRLAAIPHRGFRAALQRAEGVVTRTDEALQRAFRLGPRALGPSWLCYLAVWLLEGFETWLILQIIGVELSLGHVLFMEALVVSLRSAVVVVPAGLGVQEAGYVAFLVAFGVPAAASVGAAFSVLKRFKEAFWGLVGYVCFVLARPRKARSYVVQPAPAQAEYSASRALP